MNDLEKTKKPRKQTTFNCVYCGVETTKPTSEFNRNLKIGRKNYCSLSCSAKANNATRSYEQSYSQENLDHLKTICTNKRDEFTPFRYTFRNAQKRLKEFDITLQDLKDVWELQHGICPYSKISLILPENSGPKLHPNTRASLDRIDSSKGYVKGNIQFVSTTINYMKSEMSHEETIQFIQQLINNLSFDKD